MKVLKIVLIVVVAFIALGAVAFFFKACPPSGPWPAPPWCAGGAKTERLVAATPYDISQPKYPGSRSAFVFPPSCTVLPAGIVQSICEDWQKGAVIFWQEEACGAMPFAAGNKACTDERAKLKQVGERNAARMRKEDPDWWKTPYLNTYVYGDVRLRTEELSPTASVWGGGSYDRWRDDEIFMTQALGIRKVVSHSFAYVGENDLDYMRDRLIKDEGIAITGPQDLQKPEVVRIKTDLAYLESKSPIFRSIAAAQAKDLDGEPIVVGAMGRVSNIPMEPIAPAFKDYLIRFYTWQVDAGADGVFVDDVTGPNLSEAFNEVTLSEFRAWLAANAPEAATKVGVRDLSSFDYRVFLRSKGFTKATIDGAVGRTIGASDRWRSIPLMVEFRTFVTQARQKTLTDVVRAVRAYAAEKGRKGLVVTGNAGELAPAAAFDVPLFDYLTFEHAYAQGGDPMKWKSGVPIEEIANAKGRPVTNQLVVDQWPLYAGLAAPLRYDLLRLMVMESAAAHAANHYARYSALDPRRTTTKQDDVYLALQDRGDLAEMKKAFGFLEIHRDTYRDIAETDAKVAVVYDNDEVVREWNEDLRANYQYAVEDANRALFAKNVEFDDVDWRQLAAGKYAVVIVPPTKTLSPENAAILAQVRQRGAKILALGALPAGTPTDGTVTPTRAASTAAATIPVMKLPEGMKSLSYRDAKGDLLVNLMNYDYDASGFKTQTSIAVDPALVVGAKKIRFASIESPNFTDLDLTKPIIPAVKTYGLLMITR